MTSLSDHKACIAGLLFTLSVALTAVVSIAIHRQPPSAATGRSPDPHSLSNVIRHLTVIAHKPHSVGMPEHTIVRDYISNQLASFGYTVELQKAQVGKQLAGDFFLGAQVENLLARRTGQTLTNATLICAHYDSAPMAFGAGDNGYAVASLLEVARLLAVGSAPRHDVIFLFSDAEELGLLGAEAFLAHRWVQNIGVALNFDARGIGGPLILFESTRGNAALIRNAQAAIDHLFGLSLAEEVYRLMPNSTDFNMFRHAGLKGLNFANIHGFKHYHTPLDNLGCIEPRTIRQTFATMLGLARRFSAGTDSLHAKEDLIFFDVAGLLFISYPTSWAVWLVLVETAVFAALLIAAARQKRLGWVGMTAGTVAALLATILAFGVVAGAMIGLRWAFGLSEGVAFAWSVEPYYAAGVTCLVGGLNLTIFSFVVRKADAFEIANGVLVIWLLLAWLAAIWLPKGSYLFLICVGCLEIMLATRRRATASRIIGGVCTAAMVLVLAPTIALLFTAGGLQVAALLAPIISLGISAATVVGLACGVRAYLKPAALLASAALVCGGAGAFLRSKDGALTQYTLGYLGDAPARSGFLLTTDESMSHWQKSLFVRSSRNEALASFLPWKRGVITHAQTEWVDLPAPEARLVQQEETKHTVRLTFLLESPRRAPTVFFVISSANVDLVEVDGCAEIFKLGEGRPATMQFTGLTTPIRITLSLKSREEFRAWLYDCSYGLPGQFSPPTTNFIPARAQGVSAGCYLRTAVRHIPAASRNSSSTFDP